MSIFAIIAVIVKLFRQHNYWCPECGSSGKNHYMTNYDAMWHEGDIYCSLCDTFVRYYDAG